MAVRRDKSGTWRFRKVVRLPNGKKDRISGTPTINTKAEAEREERAAIERALSPVPKRKEVLTFAVFAKRYLKEYVLLNCKASYRALVESIVVRHLVPRFGDRPLEEITTADVEAFKAWLLERHGPEDKKRGPKTVNNELTVLRRMLRVAVDWEILDAVRPRIRPLKVPPSKFRFYDFDVYIQLVEAAAKLGTTYELIVLLGAEAGLRRGEMIGLLWTRVDLRRSQLTIDRSVWNGIEGSPKGGRSRVVPMTVALAAVLKKHRHLAGPNVLCNPDGSALTERQVERLIGAVQRRAGLEVTEGAHCLRHTFCSHLAMRGAAARAIQELAGHASITTTMRYMHLSPHVGREAIALLDERVVATTWQRPEAATERT